MQQAVTTRTSNEACCLGHEEESISSAAGVGETRNSSTCLIGIKKGLF